MPFLDENSPKCEMLNFAWDGRTTAEIYKDTILHPFACLRYLKTRILNLESMIKSLQTRENPLYKGISGYSVKNTQTKQNR